MDTHGRPIDTTEDVKIKGAIFQTGFKKKVKERQAIHKNWDLVQKEIFNGALDELGFDSVRETS